MKQHCSTFWLLLQVVFATITFGRTHAVAFEVPTYSILFPSALNRSATAWWTDGPTWRTPRLSDSSEAKDTFLRIPRVLHRSHKYGAAEVHLQPRLWANLLSCSQLNPEHESRYYDDKQADAVLQIVVDHLKDKEMSHALKKIRHGKLGKVFVLRADWFRLAALWLFGGWWLDGDVRCIDSIDSSFNLEGPLASAARHALAEAAIMADRSDCPETLTAVEDGRSEGCVLAWEGELPQPKSAPLNWALGCSPRHPFLLHTMRELARRVINLRPSKQPDPFSAILPGKVPKYVDVLHTTGPGMLGEALSDYAQSNLRGLRERFGEAIASKESWDAVSVVFGQEAQKLREKDAVPVHCPAGPVVLLPYCFFRSRGCGHLHRRFNDTIVFHHEFDTSWRPSFWHNYFDQAPSAVLADAEAASAASARLEL
eukprot:TRINITY_DN33832_c0_g1_i1.p1 TRINITY_DN33832_c0_g1~~TRINITY_DN33832_c0_g1_i1.p1  ORF type:complete len:426 (-),score=39.50 TRINITY_DN33832_c0_g1_i1:243-1520(-)